MERMTDLQDIFAAPFETAEPKRALVYAIEQNEQQILDLNRDQLDKGLDSEGRSLGKYKSFKYKGRFEPVDLKLTGAFRGDFQLKVSDIETEIISTDYKESILKKRYGADIEGVPVTRISEMQNIIIDDFINDFQKQIL